VRPDLDHWLADPAICVRHRRAADVGEAELWHAARTVRVDETRVLGRLLRWRIPGTPASIPYDELFREPPFAVLEEADGALVSGLVGRIWTLRRDYPLIAGAEGFRSWSTSGTARVVFANWVERTDAGGAALVSETRVRATDREGRVGVSAVRPLVSAFHSLIGREALDIAVRRAEAALEP
jgi:hypothetical protein